MTDSFFYSADAISVAEFIQPRDCATAVDNTASLAEDTIPAGVSRLIASANTTQALIDITERAACITAAIAARKPLMYLRDHPCSPAEWNSVQRNGKIGFLKATVSVAHVGSVDGDYGLGALLREYDYRLREVEGAMLGGRGPVEIGYLVEVVGRLEDRLGLEARK